MKHFLLPDYDFPTYKEFTPDFLKDRGIDYLLCDIDNTLVPYDVALPTESVEVWTRSLKENGISLILVSNNDEDRVKKFSAPLGVPYMYKSGKPSRRTVKKALSAIGGTKERSALLGDQLLTDVLTARVSGITSLWVPTIKKVETPFFRFKSAIERPFIKHYYKKKQGENNK